MKEDIEKSSQYGGGDPAAAPSDTVDPAQPSSSGGSHPDKDAKKASSSKTPNQETEKEDKDQEITDVYGRDALELLEKSGNENAMSAHDRFMGCDLVVPAVALSKFKQVESLPDTEEQKRIESYVGVLGEDTCRMYKKTKPRLCCLMMGNYHEDETRFWKHASTQLKDHPVGGIFTFDTFTGDISEAWYYQNMLHQRGY